MCEKASFASESIARRAMLVILAKPKAWTRTKHPVRVYRCSCGAWHMTSIGPDANTPADVVAARFALHSL